MHRFGLRIKRDILRPQTEDHAHGTTGHEEEPEHMQELRRRLEGLEGEEIKERIERLGPEDALKGIETEGLRARMGAWNLEGGDVSGEKGGVAGEQWEGEPAKEEKKEEEETLQQWRTRMAQTENDS